MTVVDADIGFALQQARIRLHRAALPAAMAGNAGIAAVLSSALWARVPHGALLAWLGMLALLLALRLALGLAHGHALAKAARSAQPEATRPAHTPVPGVWLPRYRAALLATGLSWAAAMLLLAPLLASGERDPLIYAPTALAAGALVTASFDLVGALLFAAPVAAALATAALFGGTPGERGLGCLMLVLLALAALGARRGQHAALASMRRQVDGAARAADARRLHASAEDARRQADAARQQTDDQHNLLTQLLQATPQGFWFCDNDGITTDVNPAMCALLGRPRTEIVGRAKHSFFSGDDLQALEAVFASCAAGQTPPGGFEIGLQQPGGARIDCLVHATLLKSGAGVAQGAVGIWTDISERRRTETALRSYELVANSITDLISVADRDGFYLMVNDAWCQMARLQREQVLGRRSVDVLPSNVSTERRRALRNCIETGQRQVTRGPGTRPGTAGRLLETTYYPAPEDAAGSARAGSGQPGGARYVAMVTRDITEQQRTLQQMQAHEAALIAARDEAERANRAKSQFLSQMSHELRTPLNAVSGFAQLLQADPHAELMPHQQAYVREVLRGAHSLLELIDKVLDLGRLETGKLDVDIEPVLLLPLLDECLALTQPLALAQGVQLHPLRQAADPVADPAAACAPPLVLADRVRLKQVLLNLLANAVTYNRRGGEVQLAWAAAAGGALQMQVRDNGLGMTAAEQARLFQPFERLGATGSAIHGTGVGLALSRRLMTAMGGDIGARSEFGVGSTFWLKLPAAASAAEGIGGGTSTGPAVAAPGGGPTLRG